MERMNKIVATIIALGSVVGASIAVEDRYAKETDLAKKADVSMVHRMQRVFIHDSIYNLEDDQFELEQKKLLNPLDIYRLKRIKTRILELRKEAPK